MLPSPVSAEHTPRLADRLEAARRGRFVGRVAERDLFRSALLDPEPQFAVLHLVGPGGVGKTALLREFARIATECGRSLVRLDGRNIDPSPRGFQLAARQALGWQPGGDAAAEPVWPSTGVWLIDTAEELTKLDGWLRETFLPRLPAGSLIVIAGRQPPASVWSSDPDWAALSHIITLGNLRPEESQTFLASRGIPENRHAAVLAFTHGHPLALTLVADVLDRGSTISAFDPCGEPDIVRVLLERLVDDVPSAAHRRALDVCTLTRVTTEALLADVLATHDAHDLFAWLRGQSFIEQGPQGLFPHDLAREALDADLRWRKPAHLGDIVQRLSAHFHNRLRQARGSEQQRIWSDVIFLSRKNPAFAPYFAWDALGSSYAEPAAASDYDAILAMVRRHQGDAAAEIAHHWLRRQPEAFLIYRETGGETIGFMAQLALHDVSAEDIAADPAVPAAVAYVARHGPLRPGEEIAYLRFWMHQDVHQDVSPALNLTAINASIHWSSRATLAWSFIAIANPESLAAHFTSIHIWRSVEADFEVGGRHYGVFAHDWRAEPAADWLRIKAELALTTDTDVARPSSAAPSFLVLSQEDLAEAVRQALRDFGRHDRLATSPLLRTRAIAAEPGIDPSPVRLQDVLREAVATLAGSPKDAKLHRVLWHTYFEPAPTQEQAAELLDLPFNTYRYQLARGIERITEWLWRRELAGGEG
jgi:hypothetical protein